MITSTKRKWIEGKINILKAKDGIDKNVYEAVYPHFKACSLPFERVEYVECGEGQNYFLRCVCLDLKICIETETKAEWFDRQKSKIKALTKHGFEVFFLPASSFSKRGVADLSLSVARYLAGVVMLVEDNQLVNQHRCMNCHRYYDVDKEKCKMFHHKVNIWDMACIHFNSEEFIPKKEAEQPKPKKKARKKRRNGFFLPSVETSSVQTIGFFVVKYNVPGSKLVKDVRVYRNPSMSMGTCFACANYVKAENKCRKLVEAAIKKEYPCSLYSPSSNQG